MHAVDVTRIIMECFKHGCDINDPSIGGVYKDDKGVIIQKPMKEALMDKIRQAVTNYACSMQLTTQAVRELESAPYNTHLAYYVRRSFDSSARFKRTALNNCKTVSKLWEALYNVYCEKANILCLSGTIGEN